MKSWIATLSFGLLVAVAGCHQPGHAIVDGNGDDDPDALVDAHHAGPCWPIATSTPGGSVELGTLAPDNETFMAMPDQLALEYGAQGGFDIRAMARSHGMVPGSTTDVLNPANPHTRITSYFVDPGQPDDGMPNAVPVCGFTLGYAPDPTESGAYISAAVMVELDTTLLAKDLFGKQFRVVAEVIDSGGLYAMDQKVVTALPPPNWFQDAGL